MLASRQFMNSVFRFVFLPLMISCGLPHQQATATAKADPPTISVSGKADILVVPDHAVLRFSIDSRALELATSVADNDAKVKAVVEFLSENKIESKLIKTELIRIKPILEYQPRQRSDLTALQKIEPLGYSARRQISVTISDLESFETIYRGLIERGVNEVDNLRFQTSELRKHRDLARLQAVRAAREKAQAMASELGCSLAAVQSISESNSATIPGFGSAGNLRSIAPGNVSGSVASGMIEISAAVSGGFCIGRR